MDSFDQKLGMRLRIIRQMKRISQEHLGELLGVSFQQVQKYESGSNRICPEKLNQCAAIFDVPIAYFFGHEGNKVSMGSFDKRVMTIAAAIASIPSDEVAKRIYHLIIALKNEITEDEESVA